MSKTLLVIIAIALSGIVLFAGLLYYTLRTKITVVSGKRPYSDYVDSRVFTKRDAVIALNREPDAYANPYLITEHPENLMLEVQERYALPSGTELHITSAKIFKNGTSGFKHAYVLGSVFIKELKEEVSFEYRWGDAHTSLYDDYEDYWSFPTAIWQAEEESIKEKFQF